VLQQSSPSTSGRAKRKRKSTAPRASTPTPSLQDSLHNADGKAALSECLLAALIAPAPKKRKQTKESGKDASLNSAMATKVQQLLERHAEVCRSWATKNLSSLEPMCQHITSAQVEHETLTATLGKTTAAFSSLNDYVEEVEAGWRSFSLRSPSN
jgi:hypothetical protein